MRRNYTKLGILLIAVMFTLNIFNVNAQVGEIILWDSQDAWIRNSEDDINRNYGLSWGNLVSGHKGLSHTWLQWDLQWLKDSIPEGEEVLYAETVLNIINVAAFTQGFYAVFLDDDVFDYWEEGIGEENNITSEGFTWSKSELMTGKNPYDSTYHDTLFWEQNTPSKAGGPRTFEVTNLVKTHMNGDGNKLITIRLSPTILENDGSHFFGFYSREAGWDPMVTNPFDKEKEDVVSIYSPRIKAYYGQLKTQFSDTLGFGDRSNYLTFPKNPAEFWSVDTAGGDNNRMIVQGTGVFPKISADSDGLSAMLIYNKQVYDEFDVTFDAKLAKADFSNPNLIDPEDIAFVFDWVNENTYSCFLFHQVDTIGRFFKIENGKRTLTDDVDFDFENSAANPKYDNFHAYQITRTSTAITVKIDGIAVGSTDNVEFLSGSGKIGVGTLNNQVYFDNIYESTQPAFNGLKPVFTAQDVKLFPNPVSSILNVNSETAIAQVSVYNVVGSKVLESSYINKKSALIDVSQLNNGIYFIHISNTENREIAVSKFLKVN